MLKLVRFLKPFVLTLVVAIALLYMQAMTDLALPDYMSNIVNTGIQQGGIEHASPDAITKTEMDKLSLFFDETATNQVSESYTLIESTSEKYADYAKEYSKLNGESVYVLNDLDDTSRDALDITISKALLAVAGVQGMMDNASGSAIKVGAQELPAGTDLFALMGKMPAEQRLAMTADSAQKFEAMGDKMIVQAGANLTKTYLENMGIDVKALQTKYILQIGGIMLLISLLGAVASIVVGFLAAKVAAGVGRNLRRDIFGKVSQFANAEFDKFSTASLITRSTNDITQIQTLLVIMIRMIFYAPIMAIGGIIRIMTKDTNMTWIIALAVGVLLILIVTVFAIALPKFKVVQKLVDRLNMVTRENLTGMMVIRAFNTQKFEEERFDQANKDLTNTNLFINRVMVFMMPMMMLIMNGVSLLIIWVGAHQIADSTMQVGDMMAFMQYAMQILFSFLMLSMMFIMIPRATVAAQRIAEVLDTDASVLDPKQPKKFPANGKGSIEFKNVGFKFPSAEENMLKNLNFVAKPGQTTAIIGSTGSGKTTLINLIPRFYDVTEGSIAIDGVDIRDLTQHELRKVIGYIPQKAALFSGTLETNMKFAKEDATESEMLSAAEIAQATEIIKEAEEGLQRHVSQGGSNLSGGQKQRLSIARALVKKPKIYIFDDSFSALDFKTDLAVRRALKDKTGDSTVLIVAQRISTIKQAEQIIVLEDGRMVGIGTHDELMKTCETYQEIAFSQLSKEELA